MESIKLTDEQNKKAKRHQQKERAYQQTIKLLSVSADRENEKMWLTVLEWYPELKTWEGELCYNDETGEIALS